jgi:long-chain acyl-CoA synthetase
LSTLVSQLEHSVNSASDSPAILIGDTEISYKALFEASTRLANGLQQLGIKKEDHVAVMLPNVPHFCISYYAILMLGAVIVPINFMHDADEVEHQLLDSNAKAFISWQNFLSSSLPAFHAASSCFQLIVLGEHIPSFSLSLTALIAESKPGKPEIEIADSDIAVLNYTSGITDIAMGAELSHAGLAFNASTFVDMLRITPTDRMISVLPLFHPVGQSMVMNASFAAGAPLVLALRFKAEEIVRTIQQHNVSIMPAVPGMFRALNELLGEDLALPSLKYCMSYGGFLPAVILEEFEEKFSTMILKSYGLTEAGPLVTSTRTSHERMQESSGLPLMGVEVQIRDKKGGIVRPNHSGEIFVKSPSIMKGYHGQPQETEHRMQDGWLATGDIGYIDINHYLYVQERKDDVINKGGFEIQSREVERVILDHPAIDEAAVVAAPDAVQGSEVKAFIVLNEGNQLSNKELFDFCQNLLPIYKCPHYIEKVEKLPKSPTGRILKRTLRQSGKESGKKISLTS